MVRSHICDRTGLRLPKFGLRKAWGEISSSLAAPARPEPSPRPGVRAALVCPHAFSQPRFSAGAGAGASSAHPRMQDLARLLAPFGAVQTMDYPYVRSMKEARPTRCRGLSRRIGGSGRVGRPP